MNYFIDDKEVFLKMVESWKKFKEPKACHMMLYNIIRSKPFDRGFSPVTKKSKLENGHYAWYSLKEAARQIMFAKSFSGSYLKNLIEPFGETINKEVIDQAWELIKNDPRLK